MMSEKKLIDIKIWQKAKKIADAIHSLTGTVDFDKALEDELNKSVDAILENIKKGYEKDRKEDFILFLKNAKKASQAARSQVYDAFDRHFISKEDYDYFYNELAHLSAAIGEFKIQLLFPKR